MNPNVTGNDRTSDIHYVMEVNNTDRYPLIALITSFDIGTCNGMANSFDIISNSTVSNMQVNVPTSGQLQCGYSQLLTIAVVLESKDLWETRKLDRAQ